MKNLRRIVTSFAFCAVLAAAGTGHAQVRIGLYPPQASEPAYAKDLQSILEVALSTVHRRGVFSSRYARLSESCPAPVTTSCLAAQARGGAVLLARLNKREGRWLATMVLVDSRGRVTRPVSFPFDPNFQDTGLADRALEILEGHWSRLLAEVPSTTAAQAATTPAPSSNASPAVTPTATPDAPKAAATEPAAQQVEPQAFAAQSAPEDPASEKAESSPRAWMGRTGPWIAGAGAILLVGGAAAGYADKRINDRLTDAYRKGTLSSSDGSAYTQVAVLNVVANSLLAVGGVAAATGVCFWALTPQAGPIAGGAQLGITGSF